MASWSSVGVSRMVSHLYKGGYDLVPVGLPPAVYHTFIGCVHRVVADDTTLHLEYEALLPAIEDLHYCEGE